MSVHISRVNAFYDDPAQQGISLASTVALGNQQHISRNFAFVAAGVYSWEIAQSVGFDIRLFCSLICRLFIAIGRAFCSRGLCNAQDSSAEVSDVQETCDVKLASACTPRERTSDGEPSLESKSFGITTNALSTIAQLTHVLLRLFTMLGLLALLVVLNSSEYGDSLYAYGETSELPLPVGLLSCTSGVTAESTVNCYVHHLMRIGSLVAPLLSFALSNLLLMLRAVSAWSTAELDKPASLSSSPGPAVTPYSVHALWFFFVLLHSVQHVLVAILGVWRSKITFDSSEDAKQRKLVIGTFVYFAFLDLLAISIIFIGIIRWRNSIPQRADIGNGGSRNNPAGHRSSMPIFRRSCGHLAGSECPSECGVYSYGTLSNISFAPKSAACASESSEIFSPVATGDEENDQRSLSGSMTCLSEPGCLREAIDKCQASDCSQYDCVRVECQDRRPALEGSERKRNSWAERREHAAGSGNMDRTGLRSRGSWHDVSCTEPRPVLASSNWSVLYARQGLLWITTSVITKIGVLICVMADNTWCSERGTALDLERMYFFAPALVIIMVSSGRLFQLITRASLTGDGYMEWDPRSPLSSSTSLMDIGIDTLPLSGDRVQRPPLSYQTRPTTLVRVGMLPPYVERKLYTRRVRHEVEAAADGAVRTIGGTVVAPPPALIHLRSKGTKSTQGLK